MRLRPCIECGALSQGSRCPRHTREQRRARRSKGYDDPAYRKARRNVSKHVCERCGLRAAEVVHHRDRNPENNRPSNHRFLCNDCHRDEHRV